MFEGDWLKSQRLKLTRHILEEKNNKKELKDCISYCLATYMLCISFIESFNISLIFNSTCKKISNLVRQQNAQLGNIKKRILGGKHFIFW